MSSMLGIDTAIGWAHWRVRGGWRNALLTTGAYMGIIIVIILLTIRADPRGYIGTLAGWRVGLLLLEAGLLILLAGTRVGSAVRSDITSRMIESHRLMPVSPWVAITGYLWGPAGQSVILAAATFLMGLVVVMAAGMMPATWIGPTIVLVSFSIFFWVVMAFLGSVVRTPGGLIATAVFLMIVTRLGAFSLFPGLVPLLTPFMGFTVFQARTGAMEFDWTMPAAWMSQLWIGAALYIGAARKYRRAEDSALAVLPAMMLLTGWVGVNALATARWDDFAPRWYWQGALSPNAALMGALCSAVLLALVPVSNAAQMRRSPLFMPIVALGCTAIILTLGLVWIDHVNDPTRALLTTAAGLAGILLSCGYIMAIAYRRSGWVLGIVLPWLILLFALPVIVDTALWGLTEPNEWFEMTWISAISPAGACSIAWLGESDASVLPGVLVQCALALAWGTISHLTGRRSRKTPNPEPAHQAG